MTQAAPELVALEARLRVAAGALLETTPRATARTALDADALLTALVSRARADLRADQAWLLLVAVSGHLPCSDDVEDLLRHLELARDATDAEIWLLRRAKDTIAEHGPVGLPLRVVADAVVLDVGVEARHGARPADPLSAVARVTREVSERWTAAHDVTLATWLAAQSALRTTAPGADARVLVPWRCTVVLTGVAQGRRSGPLAALAQYSGNTVVAIGYDTVPVVSADLRPPTDPNQFVRYLTVLKHARRVAAVSASAATEFRGFADAVRAQGIDGPDVAEVLLATQAPTSCAGRVARTARVVCMGADEALGNHLAVLHAAELLWRDGIVFELVFADGPGDDRPGKDVPDREPSAFAARLAALRDGGRAVARRGPTTADERWSLYRSARFTVSATLQAGFDLPVAESLACGTPVVATRYGSAGELGRRGGCVPIDPRDDHELAAAMRSLLTDDRRYAVVKTGATTSAVRTWAAYAAELWAFLVDGEAPAR